ncbi:unnamed protein product [Symbiodinium microadriaticum]|nr:unnamed protein product [Symbiodinium microadriaticum]
MGDEPQLKRARTDGQVMTTVPALQDMPRELADFLGLEMAAGSDVTAFSRDEKSFMAVEEVSDSFTGDKITTKTTGKEMHIHAETDASADRPVMPTHLLPHIEGK